jgi:HSP20 family protein
MRHHTVPSLFDQVLGLVGNDPFAGFGERVAAPPLDVIEHADRLEVKVDLPGVTEKELEVEFAEGRLAIRGTRSAPAPQAEGARVLHRERRGGRFERVLAVGDQVDVSKISARFHDGVLVVTLPKSESARPRQIPIGVN